MIYAVNKHTPDGVVVVGFYKSIDEALQWAAVMDGSVTSEKAEWWPGVWEVLG